MDIEVYCINKTSGKNIIYFVSPKPYIKQNATIIMVEIRKLTIPLVTIEIGNISRGKYTFFTILPFPIIVHADCDIDVVKNVHGTNPTHTKTT